MAIRKIFVPLIGTGSDRKALAVALRVAKLEGAHVEGVYLRPDPAASVPFVAEAASAAIVDDLYQATKVAADKAAESARQALDSACREAGIPLQEDPLSAAPLSARFIDKVGTVAGLATVRARLADLVVTAAVNENPPLLAAFEAVLIGARRPVLVGPKAESAAFGGEVVIAWNGSTESARAVSSALPFLKRARRVRILSGDLDEAEGTPARGLVVYLGLHGVGAAVESFEGKGQPLGPALLERAQAMGADLLVMGGYGHSRLRELILGGVTRHMITNAALAVLYAH